MMFENYERTAGYSLQLRRVLAVMLLLLAVCSFAAAEDVPPPVLLTPLTGEFFKPDFAADKSWPDYRPDGTHYGYEQDHWDGCSVWCAVSGCEKTAESSGCLVAQGAYSYEADHLIDSSRNTAWAEGVPGHGFGESTTLTRTIVLSNEENMLTYTGLCIVNGYARTEEAWRNNGRVKRLIVYKDDQYLCDLLLKNTMKPQYFDLSELKLDAASGETVCFRFVIADVWPGDRYSDTALTGIEFAFSTPNH